MSKNFDIKPILKSFGIKAKNESAFTGKTWITALNTQTIDVDSPTDGNKFATVTYSSATEYEAILKRAELAAKEWRNIPAPKRGDIVRQYGELLREHKDNLGKLVSYEMGKSLAEGKGEVQEMIDICEFAVGLSRQLYGLTMKSERTNHRMYEQWHPLGVIGIISAFNFPVAVWAWNSMIAAVCGNASVWKPSEKSPISAVACMQLMHQVVLDNNLPEGLFTMIQGDYQIGEMMVNDERVKLISATGSTRMGKIVAENLGRRLGKGILELGGNNAIIISEHANLEMAIKGTFFGAIGTCGQRCTSTRRLIVHEKNYKKVKDLLIKAYKQLKIGNPLDSSNHCGPLIDKDAVIQFENALAMVKKEGGKILWGGKRMNIEDNKSSCYVLPALVEAYNHYQMVQQETFAPILYIMKYSKIEEAIAMQNDVKQGLSSAIFTDNLQEAELFLSNNGSDCGIANVNIGTSGAEIGGAFGGEKETGGGRESGSDAWKGYMRRQTNTINYGNDLPLAQGIEFDF
jgi:aldehyde dehydrogenase (NAD+)